MSDMETTTNGAEMTTEQQNAEALALDAESRIDTATTQDERDYWTRMADFWWGQA